MKRWTTLLYGLIVRPSQAMADSIRSFSWGLGLLTLLAATLSWHFGSALLFRAVLPTYPAVFVLMFPVRAVLVIALWILAVALTHLVARGLKGYGTTRSLFLVLGLATAPFILITPLAVLSSALGAFGVLTFLLGAAAVGLWALALAILGVKHAYYLGGGASTVAVLAPWLVLPLGVAGALAVYGGCWLSLSALNALVELSQYL